MVLLFVTNRGQSRTITSIYLSHCTITIILHDVLKLEWFLSGKYRDRKQWYVFFLKGILKLLGFVIVSHKTCAKDIEVPFTFERTFEGNMSSTVVECLGNTLYLATYDINCGFLSDERVHVYSTHFCPDYLS